MDVQGVSQSMACSVYMQGVHLTNVHQRRLSGGHDAGNYRYFQKILLGKTMPFHRWQQMSLDFIFCTNFLHIDPTIVSFLLLLL